MIPQTKVNTVSYLLRNIVFSWIASLVRIVLIVLIFVLRNLLISSNVTMHVKSGLEFPLLHVAWSDRCDLPHRRSQYLPISTEIVKNTLINLGAEAKTAARNRDTANRAPQHLPKQVLVDLSVQVCLSPHGFLLHHPQISSSRYDIHDFRLVGPKTLSGRSSR